MIFLCKILVCLMLLLLIVLTAVAVQYGVPGWVSTTLEVITLCEMYVTYEIVRYPAV